MKLDTYLVVLMAFYAVYLFGIFIFIFRKRAAATKARRISIKYFTDYQGESPSDLRVLENHANNQFQVPIYFMVTGVLAIQQGAVGLVIAGLATVFVLSRLVHTYIHLGSNHVLRRAGAYFVGFLSVTGIWLCLLLSLWLQRPI